MSPTELSLRHLRKRFALVAVTERWNPHARCRQDLFGCIDILAVGPGTLAVQTTTGANLSARVKKLRASPAVPILEAAGWRITAHGWVKRKGRWVLREQAP